MAIELEDGTIVRSLPEQVDYLTTKNEENEVAIDNLAARLEAAIAGVLHYKGSVATYDDLPADAEIGDVYNVIDTGSNYAWTGEEWDELGSSVDISNLVSLDGTQTITGIKTFENGIDFNQDSSIISRNSGELTITAGNDYLFTGTEFRPETDAGASLGKSNIRWDKVFTTQITNDFGSFVINGKAGITLNPYTTKVVRPSNDGDADLGEPTRRWKAAYFSDNVSALNSINLIKAEDIASNYLLTQDQLDLVMNGKPTIILGSYRGVLNALLLGLESSGTTRRGWFITRNEIRMYYLNTSTGELGWHSSSQQFGYLGSVYSLNGKAVPAWPSNTGTFVLKCIDGALTWVAE